MTADLTAAVVAWLRDLDAFDRDHPRGWMLTGCGCTDHADRHGVLMARKRALLALCEGAGA